MNNSGSSVDNVSNRDIENKKVICFRLLGTFSYTLLEEETDLSKEEGIFGHDGKEYQIVPGKIGKKMLSFLQYLIVNHTRNITTEEILDVFWTEENSSDPANALRNMIFKTRSLLKTMFPEQDNLLQTFQGGYVWNSEIAIELDTELFEKICLGGDKTRRYSDEKRMEMLRQAIAIYNGDFLSSNDSEWVVVQRQYYRALYLSACKELLPMLEKKEEWMEMISLCGRAYQIDFCIEEFTIYSMQAYIAMGQPEQAVERYEIFRKRMLEELGISPTERIEQIYTLALGLHKGERKDDEEIFKLVCSGDSGNQAFFCNFGMFQNIVRLEMRHIARSGHKSTLVIVSIDRGAVPTTDARRLERILLECLRTGDPVARLEASSYILMLTGADAINAQIVTNRLDCAFHKKYRHSSAQLSFRMAPLHPEEEEV